MKASKSTEAVLTWLEKMQPLFTAMADEIWAKPESSWQEFNASRTQAHYLAGQDFSVTWDLAGMNTAFLAEWGEGKPILGFIGEYDALPGLSQKRQSSKEIWQDHSEGTVTLHREVKRQDHRRNTDRKGFLWLRDLSDAQLCHTY